MNSISDQKKALRKKLMEKRLDIPKSSWESISRTISDHTLSLIENNTTQCIHCYVSMSNRKEVDTHFLINALLELDKRVFIPVTNFQSLTLKHVEISTLDDLVENKWGVLEPKEEVIATEKDFELILVPLLAADLDGNRLGYGKGFYDRFLSTSKAKKMGLLFDEFVLDKLPVENFDEKLDGFITENGVRYL